MAKNFVSNSTESTRMFKSDFMESLSKVHFAVPLFIYIPVIGIFAYLSLAVLHSSVWAFFGYYALGLVIWTLTEYLLHRFIFHFHPSSEWGKRIHFIFHGVHHDYPKDKKRLVMPPSVSLPLAVLFYFLFSLFLNHQHLWAFFPGFLTGYLIYDMMHYAMHHHNFKSPILKKVKQHHMLHHYQDEAKGFGVSSELWDRIFFSGFPKKKKSASGLNSVNVPKQADNAPNTSGQTKQAASL